MEGLLGLGVDLSVKKQTLEGRCFKTAPRGSERTEPLQDTKGSREGEKYFDFPHLPMAKEVSLKGSEGDL